MHFSLIKQGYIATHPIHSSPNTKDHHEYCIMQNQFHVPVAFYVSLSLMNLLIVVNSSVNFVVYCVVENSFREELLKMLMYRKW